MTTPYLKSILSPVFKKWKVPLENNNGGKNRFTNDFGLHIKKLLIAKEINEKTENPIHSQLAGKPIWEGITFQHTLHNMEELAHTLGIDLHKSDKFYYIRDHFFRLHDGSIHIARSSKMAQKAIMQTRSSNLYRNCTATTRTRNQIFNSWGGYAQEVSATIVKDAENAFSEIPISFPHTFVEGGNLFTLTNQQGHIKILAGQDHLLQNLLILELEKQPWEELSKKALNKSFIEIQEEIDKTLTKDWIKMAAEEMFSAGMLFHHGKTGLIERQQQLNLLLMKFMIPGFFEEEDWYHSLAVRTEALPPFDPTETEIEAYRPLVAGYLTKKKITHGLMARDFKVNLDDFHFIDQVNYHLDTFIAPGPQNSVFVTNFSLWTDILESLAQADLSEQEQEHLQRYIETSKKMDQELGPLLKDVEKQIEEADFTVIPMPGHLVYESKTMYQEFPVPSGGFNINFINALVGWSPLTKKEYYITHGLQVGEKLGGLIREAFTLFLKEYVPSLDVYFIGKDPKNPTDFSEAMDWWNRLETQSGIHCLTFDIE